MAHYFSRLRTRIFLIIFLSALPLLGMFSYIHLKESREAAQHAQEHVLLVAQQFALTHSLLINDAKQLLMVLAHCPSVRQPDTGAASAFLKRLLPNNRNYSNLFVADISGLTIKSALPLSRPVTAADNRCFQRTLETKDFAIGAFKIGKLTDKPTLHLGYPVLDQVGDLRAVVMASLNLDWLQDLAAKVKLPAGSSVCIIDDHGTILARLREPEKWVGQSRPEAEIVKTVLAQHQGVAEAQGVDGISKLYAFLPLGGGPQEGFVYVGIPTQVIYDPTNQALARNLMATGIVATLALVLAWALAYPFVMRRVNLLVSTARQVAAGDLSARTGLDYGASEIDQLAQSFDGMTQALQLREAQILRQQAILEGINRIFRQALTSPSDAELSQTCLEVAATLTDSPFGFIGELNQAGRLDSLVLIDPGWEACRLPPTETALKNMELQGLFGKVLREGQPLIANDPRSHPDSIGTPEGHPPLTAFLGVPLQQTGKTIGIIALANKEGGYAATDQDAAETIAVATVQALMGKLAEDKLTRFRDRHELILASTSEGILGLDLQGRMTFVNPAAARLLGYEDEQELLDRSSHTLWHHSKPDGSPYPEAECPILATLRGGESHLPEEDFFWRKDGTGFPVRYSRNPIMENGQIVGAVITFWDITMRKQTEESLRRTARALRVLSSVNEVLIRATEEADLLKDICRVIVAVGGYRLTYIGCALQDEAKTVRIGAFAGEDRGYLRQAKITWGDDEWGQGPTGAAIRTGKSCIVRDIRTNPAVAPWRQQLVDLGFAAAIGLPLKLNQEIIGGLTIAASDPAAFVPEEVELLEELAGDLSYGIISLRARKARRQAEAALRDREEHYRTLVDTSPDVILQLNMEGEIVAVNRQAAILTGHADISEIIGRDATDFVVPEDRPRFLEAIRQVIETGGIRDLRLTGIRQDGSTYPIEANATLTPSDAGTPQGIIGVVRDITARQQAEIDLRKGRETFKALLDATQETVLLLDRQGIVLAGNEVAAQRLGTSIKKLKGSHIFDFMSPEVAKRRKAGLDVVVSTGRAARCEDEHSGRYHDNYVQPVFGETGEVEGFAILSVDITERKQAAELLQQSMEKVQEVLNDTVQVLASTVETKDPYTAGHQQRVARLACAIAAEMGLSPDQIEGLRVMGYLHDIGKIAVPAEILSKPVKISATEFNIIKEHPQAGFDILKVIKFPWPVGQGVLQHHERLDGSGYPSGLTDGDIILEARILAVADVAEAMASHRPYRPALGIDKALKEITRNKGILYDPEVVDTCVRLFKEKGFKFED
jgi:PAS domain S-box-containing protein/putative nucleotidyltransferase with HDIG domain